MALKMKEWGSIFNLLQKEQRGVSKKREEGPKKGEGGPSEKGGSSPARNYGLTSTIICKISESKRRC